MTALLGYSTVCGPRVTTKQLMQRDGVLAVRKPATLLAALLALVLGGCQNGVVYSTSSLMDANDKCMEQHVWSTTGAVGWGTPATACPNVGWYRERQALDAKEAGK